MSKKMQDELWEEFCDLVVKLRSRKAVKKFFCDLFNRTERLTLIRRLQVASLLETEFTYEEIRKMLGAGSQLVSRVQRWLEFGRGGYKQAVKLLSERERAALRRKYHRIYGR